MNGIKHTALADFTVGIVGGGVAGATAALKLAGLGIKTHLFEKNSSLVSGPPICHLHAGGNLYRDISEQQCITLLEQSIATLRAYPHSVNYRPTVIAIPQSDPGEPEAILSRLRVLTDHYRTMIANDENNGVLGSADDYFALFSKEDMVALSKRALPETPTSIEDWMVPVAKYMPHDAFKYPVVVVQEYGLSVFRLAATAALGLEATSNCQIHYQHDVIAITESENRWDIVSTAPDGIQHTQSVDFVINAGGYKTGTVDNMLNVNRERWVEYKAAYVAHWTTKPGMWPEVIVHGERGTPQGMGQLTPYPDGFIQLHGMTQNITLFDDGLVKSTPSDAQPLLPLRLVEKAEGVWGWSEVRERTERAITHFAQWLPDFASAEVGGKPLCGAQQVPGSDPSLRAADATFEGDTYARIELVKASSALQAIDRILAHCEEKGWITLPESWREPTLSLTATLTEDEVVNKAIELAKARNYPDALARPYP
ncbi:FAD-dependent oxidoreductase [Enterovibrio sp. ZSDZ35]|uniref:FAD-dependent oxidoreductase n=1 Tax=Enterovibrio qingdaonensis TaxID=2899818 RepID=A0ABT5QT47_9GAMM|nr:FAD-dependent oxidoreductase [Enterovibrio sp. ZSDZ35]MDD1784150.1 FAD-dependent oxidoreductase [Enterovibrio sp. ZSDZ35]